MTILTSIPRQQLFSAIRDSWRADTSAAGEWSPENPSHGQCAVTALLLQDYLGGTLMRCTVGGVSHYWTYLPSGEDVDLTREQFPTFEPDGDIEERSRDYVLGFEDTARRYRTLAARVREALGLDGS